MARQVRRTGRTDGPTDVSAGQLGVAWGGLVVGGQRPGLQQLWYRAVLAPAGLVRRISCGEVEVLQRPPVSSPALAPPPPSPVRGACPHLRELVPLGYASTSPSWFLLIISYPGSRGDEGLGGI